MFGLLFHHLFLKFNSSGLKFIQSLFQIGDFLLDLAELCLFFGVRQTILAKLFGDVPLKLTSQKPEIWISPYRPFSVFKFAGANALHNEVPVYSIFLIRRFIAESCPFAIPLTVFNLLSLGLD